jgi:hypothetical protein
VRGVTLVIRLLLDVCVYVSLLIRPRWTLAAENLFLRKQLAKYQERGVEPSRPDAALRLTLVVLSRWFDWRNALSIVVPRTFIRWQRAGFRRHAIPIGLRVVSRPVLGGLHHEYGLEPKAV